MNLEEAVSKIVVFDPRMHDLLRPGARLERLCTGATWSEGPVYFHEDDSVVWSDIPNDRLLRWSARDGMGVWRAPANFENGHYRDHEGRLISCEHGRRCVSRTEADGTVTILANRYQGKRLNSPNDVVVKSDGTIWFTDPPYGILSDYEGFVAPSELGDNYVFRLDPGTGELRVVTDLVEEPNGLAFSPDERLLYVSDTSCVLRTDGSGHHHIMVFDVREDGRGISGGRVFAVIHPGVADGFRLDVAGNVFTSATDGVQVYAPDGTRLGLIPVPEKVGNLTFGGPDKRRLFIAASTSLYAFDLVTAGIQRP